jgi:hypothetical protein
MRITQHDYEIPSYRSIYFARSRAINPTSTVKYVRQISSHAQVMENQAKNPNIKNPRCQCSGKVSKAGFQRDEIDN